MAEKAPRVATGCPEPLCQPESSDDESSKSPLEMLPSNPECPVCLQLCIHPVEVPCGHIFCFLCVKGASNQNQRCALCRQAIPPAYFDNPTLLADSSANPSSTLAEEKERYAWFYEGRNGWWQYDKRTNSEIEDGYRNKKRSFELLIAGYMYIIDLDNMTQMRRSDPSRRRRIKRDLMTAPKKGIAGLKLGQEGGDDEGASTASGDTGDQEQSPVEVHDDTDNQEQSLGNPQDISDDNDGNVQSYEPSADLSEGMESLSLASDRNTEEQSRADQEETNDDEETIVV